MKSVKTPDAINVNKVAISSRVSSWLKDQGYEEDTKPATVAPVTTNPALRFVNSASFDIYTDSFSPLNYSASLFCVFV